MKLSKAVIKKYGISKKAWAVQRGKSGKTRKIKKRAVNTASRSYKRMAKKKSYRKKSSSMFGKLNRPITGAAGVVLYESLISPMIPLQGTAKDLLELGMGAYLSKKKGIIGATGNSLVVINSYQLISGLVGNKLQGLIGGNGTIANSFGTGGF